MPIAHTMSLGAPTGEGLQAARQVTDVNVNIWETRNVDTVHDTGLQAVFNETLSISQLLQTIRTID